MPIKIRRTAEKLTRLAKNLKRLNCGNMARPSTAAMTGDDGEVCSTKHGKTRQKLPQAWPKNWQLERL